MFRWMIWSICLVLSVLENSAPADARNAVSKTGTLVCTTADTPTSARATADISLSCNFTSESGTVTNLNGFVARKGDADFPAGKRVLVWTVLAPSGVDAELVGQFTGHTGGEKAGRLAGGRDRLIVLEPVTPTSQIGGKIAPTVLHLRLEATKV